MYSNALECNIDEIWVEGFSFILKKGKSIIFVTCRNRQAESLLWKDLKEWAIETWNKQHQLMFDVTSLGSIKWKVEQNPSCCVEDFKLR